MEELLAIKLKTRNGGSTIIDREDVEALYLGEIVECLLYKDKELSRGKKAKQAMIHLKKSADKFYAGGKLSVFEKICGEHRIYSIELLFQDSLEEYLVPYESDNAFAVNNLENHQFENGLNITFRDKSDMRQHHDN